MLCILIEMSFESLICWFDVWASSLFYEFISICFSLLEKALFFKLDSSSTHPRQISFLSSLFLVISTYPLQLLDPLRKISELSVCLIDILSIEPSSCDLNISSIDSRSIEENFWAFYLLDRFSTNPRSIEVSGFSLDSILFHYIHAFIWIPCAPLIIFLFLGWSFIASCTLCQSWQKGGEKVGSF